VKFATEALARASSSPLLGLVVDEEGVVLQAAHRIHGSRWNLRRIFPAYLGVVIIGILHNILEFGFLCHCSGEQLSANHRSCLIGWALHKQKKIDL
jgi:hypothetical protein